ncbi:MAG: hypothetical protein FWD17_04120 [Polyangiaceae bacterium]|nr:hypothetical protein [Polyangiaceae bacterium]
MNRTSTWALAGLAALLGACGGAATSPPSLDEAPDAAGHAPSTVSESLGRIDLELVLPRLEPVVASALEVHWQLANASSTIIAAGTVRGGSDIVTGPLQPASGYAFALQATDDAGVVCTGAVGPFTLVAGGSPQVVTASLTCTATTVTANTCCSPSSPASYCGAWQSVTGVPPSGTVAVGDRAVITVVATGADLTALGYAWSTSDPFVAHLVQIASDAGASEDVIAVVCDAPGSTSLQVIVTDGPVPTGGTCATDVSSNSFTIACADADAGAAVAADASPPVQDASAALDAALDD